MEVTACDVMNLGNIDVSLKQNALLAPCGDGSPVEQVLPSTSYLLFLTVLCICIY